MSLCGMCSAAIVPCRSAFDPEEFYGVAWFALDALPLNRTDPHLARFVAKLRVQADRPQ